VKVCEYSQGFPRKETSNDSEVARHAHVLRSHVISCDMSFKEHIASQINKANSMLGLINRNFRDIKQNAFIMLYKSLVRSHLEYANSV